MNLKDTLLEVVDKLADLGEKLTPGQSVPISSPRSTAGNGETQPNGAETRPGPHPPSPGE